MLEIINNIQFSFLGMISILIILYLAALLILFKGQRKLLYHPDRTLPMLSEYGLSDGAEELKIQSHDGLLLPAWYRKPKDLTKPLIVYFHGNAGHIGGRVQQLRFFRDQGYGFLITSYRYNAGNNGKPSEESLLRDGQSIINWATNKGHSLEDIILYGESLGSGLAVSLGQNNLTKAIILEGAYSSISDVAAEKYKLFPVRSLILDEFDSKSYITNLMQPVLILHGAKDETIALKFAEKLFAAADQERAVMDVFPEGRHVDLYDHGAGKSVSTFIGNLKEEYPL